MRQISVDIAEIPIMPGRIALQDARISGGIVDGNWELGISTRLWTHLNEDEDEVRYGPFEATYRQGYGLVLSLNNVPLQVERPSCRR